VSVEHTDVAAYSLGLLDQPDRRAFEDHLAQCHECAAEVAELAGMADLLRGMDPVPVAEEPPGEAEVVELVRRRASAQRRHTRWQAVAAVAAAIVLLAGGAVAGLALSNSPATTTAVVALQGQRHTAINPATGVAGTVGLLVKPWGTQVTMDLSKVRGPLECELIAVSKTGERRIMVGWLVPAAGYGVPGHPAHLLLEGGTSIKRADLARVDVDVVNGRTLVSIPV
jgi:hypothetical protein